MLLAALVLLPACFPTNRLQSSDDANSTPITTGGSTTSDGARGQCVNIDKSRPERNLCIECYSEILELRCPGKETPSECIDTTVATTFTNLVNQCILSKLTNGSSCSKTCSSGLILEPTSCTCVVPPGGGNIPPIDSGEVNYGPPVVELDWPLTYVDLIDTEDKTLNSCKVRIEPLYFQVQNRGNTVPQFNQYNVGTYSCTHGGTTGYLENVATPTWGNGKVYTTFGLTTAGSGELFSTSTAAVPMPDEPFRNATAGFKEYELAVADGDYLLNFDLKIADGWLGAADGGPHGFKVTRFTAGPGDGILLNNTFSTLASQPQSFPGKPLAKGSNLFVDAAKPDAWFRISLPLTHTCGGCALKIHFEATGFAGADAQQWALENLSLRKRGIETFAGAAAAWSGDAEGVEDATATDDFTVFRGPFTDQQSTTLTLDKVPAGKYLVSFDFFVLDSWFGEGGGQYSPYPLTASGISTGSVVTAGGMHSCARLTNNTAHCWGENQNGQIGNGVQTDASLPTLVKADATTTLANVTSVEAGSQHTCAVVSGAIKCWGLNSSGQLGINSTGTTSVYPASVTVAGTTGVAALSAGSAHTCAIYTTGAGNRTYCWGKNSSGQVGDGSAVNRTAPAAIAAMNGATHISAGGNHTCAVASDAKVHCWGAGAAGQLGDDEYVDHAIPFEVPVLTNITQVAAGGAHSCSLNGDGVVQCWGDNTFGQLGNGNTNGSVTPVTVSLGIKATSISAGENHNCAVLEDANIRCWGSNASGKLGNGTINDASTPTRVVGLASTASAVSAGESHSCAIMSTGKVHCWGMNASSQLGNPAGKNKFLVKSTSPKDADNDGIADGTIVQTVFEQSFSNTDYLQSYKGTATALKEDMGYLLMPDSIYRLNVLVHHSCIGTAPCDFKLDFIGHGLDETRSWGIDNVGIMLLPECGIQYSFTDTNQLTSNYCLRFNPYTSCGQADYLDASGNVVQTCESWVRPVIGTITPYFAPLSTGESCP